ncbi:hypothetical protein BJY01DRAFT_229807 [Aspergillus pseudoustus]|uniref:Uncharacterized protein n=1 Tax=Aspergillus pseudoustus TaxID=1810923 RepID=A0ABR4IF03_9EURO
MLSCARRYFFPAEYNLSVRMWAAIISIIIIFSCCCMRTNGDQTRVWTHEKSWLKHVAIFGDLQEKLIIICSHWALVACKTQFKSQIHLLLLFMIKSTPHYLVSDGLD